MHTYVCIYIHNSMHTCIPISTYIHIHKLGDALQNITYTCKCIYIHIHPVGENANACIHTRVFTLTREHERQVGYTHIHSHVYIHIQTVGEHTHACIHTRVFTLSRGHDSYMGGQAADIFQVTCARKFGRKVSVCVCRHALVFCKLSTEAFFCVCVCVFLC